MAVLLNDHNGKIKKIKHEHRPILEERLIKEEKVVIKGDEILLKGDYYKKQYRIALRNCGIVDQKISKII